MGVTIPDSLRECVGFRERNTRAAPTFLSASPAGARQRAEPGPCRAALDTPLATPPICPPPRARGTAVAHSLHTGGVTGSIPVAPTIFSVQHTSRPHPKPAAADIAAPGRYRAPAMATAPPLLQLSDIALTFGGTPLLDGAELAVAAGERVCLVGRNGSGKSTLLKIAAGLIEPDRGTRFVQPGATRPLPAAGAGSLRLRHARWPTWRTGLGPTDDPHQARYLLQQLGLERRGGPGIACRAARRAARRWPACWRRRPTSCCSTSRPTTSTCRPSSGWRASSPQPALRPSCSSATTGASWRTCRAATVWLDRGATRRIEHRLSRLRGLARRAARRGGGGPAQARPQDRRARSTGVRYGVTRAAQAQRAPHGRPAGAAREPPRLPPRRRQGGDRRRRGGAVRRAGDRGQGRSPRRSASRPIVRDFSHARHARRPPRHRRPERQRQDHAGQPADRRARARQPARSGSAPTWRWRPSTRAARASIPNWTLERGADRRPRRHGDGRRPDQARRRLHEGLPVRAAAGAHAAARAVGRRARPPDAGPRAGQAVQPAGARRADQRSRPGDARRAGGDAGRLRRHRHPDQPRPRFPRSRRQCGAGAGGRRAAGSNTPAATPTCWRSAAPISPAPRRRRRPRPTAAAEPAAAATPAKTARAPAELQREARARDAARADRRAAGRGAPAAAAPGATRPLRPRPPGVHRGQRRRLPPRTAELAAAEERWLELEMLREEIEGSSFASRAGPAPHPVVPKARVSDATGTPARPPAFLQQKAGSSRGVPSIGAWGGAPLA